GATFDLSAQAPSPSGTEVYSWSKLSGPGQVTFSKPNGLITTARVATGGSYVLEIVRANGDLTSRDQVHVTALSRPLRIDQAALVSDGRFQMQLNTDPGSFVIEATGDFRQWDIITNVVSPDGHLIITDPQTTLPHRFYRVRVGP